MGITSSLPCCGARPATSGNIERPRPYQPNEVYRPPGPFVPPDGATPTELLNAERLHYIPPNKRGQVWYFCHTMHCRNWIWAKDIDHTTTDCPMCGYSWRWSMTKQQGCIATPPATPSWQGTTVQQPLKNIFIQFQQLCNSFCFFAKPPWLFMFCKANMAIHFFLQSLVAPRVVHAPPTMLFQCDSILPFLAGPGT